MSDAVPLLGNRLVHRGTVKVPVSHQAAADRMVASITTIQPALNYFLKHRATTTYGGPRQWMSGQIHAPATLLQKSKRPVPSGYVCPRAGLEFIQKNKLRDLSPQANYTDRSTATCRRNLVPTFVDRGVSRGQRGGSRTVVNLNFLDRSRYFIFQVAPHLSLQGLSRPRSRLTATQKIW
jgi:hypothetical protein